MAKRKNTKPVDSTPAVKYVPILGTVDATRDGPPRIVSSHWRFAPFPSTIEELDRVWACGREARCDLAWKAAQCFEQLTDAQAHVAEEFALQAEDDLARPAHALGDMLVCALQGRDAGLFAVAVAAYHALGDYDRRTFEKVLTGKRTNARTIISAFEEQFTHGCSTTFKTRAEAREAYEKWARERDAKGE